MKKIYFTIIFVGTIFLFCTTVSATLVKALNIKQLTALSHQIVKAEVVKKEIVDDVEESKAIVVCYTLKVQDWLKGSSAEIGDEIVIKQLADGTTQANGRILKQHFGLPSYLIGKSYLFFLPSPSEKTGLSAPIGLQQGVYEIGKDTQGRDAVPVLKGRVGILKKGLMESDRKTRSLVSGLEGLRNDQSYDAFKRLILTSLGEE